MFAGLDERLDVFGGMFQNVVVEKNMVFLEDHDNGRAAEGEIAFFFAAQEDGAVVGLGDGGDGEGSDFDVEGLAEIGEIKHGNFSVVRSEDVEMLVERKRIDRIVFAFYWP